VDVDGAVNWEDLWIWDSHDATNAASNEASSWVLKIFTAVTSLPGRVWDGDEACLTRSPPVLNQSESSRSRPWPQRLRFAASHCDHGRPTAEEIGRQSRQKLVPVPPNGIPSRRSGPVTRCANGPADELWRNSINGIEIPPWISLSALD
jgi:hypothetical protein